MDHDPDMAEDVSMTSLRKDLEATPQTADSPSHVVPLESVQRATNDIAIPDGGLRAWLTVCGGWIVLFCTFGYASSFGVYQAYYQAAGTSTASNISWIGSFQLFLMFAMGLPAGKLFDEGFFRHIQASGAFLYVFGLFMLSLADTRKYYQIFLSQGICLGLGSGLMFVPALSVQAHHWKRRRALAMGIVPTGSSIGGIVYPVMLNQLFHSSVGFRWGIRASAFLSLGLLVIANCIMSTRLPSARQQRTSSSGLAQVVTPSINGILLDRPFMLAVAGTFLVLWGLFFPYFYLQIFISSHGLSNNLAFYSLSILNAASILGRTLPNLLADNIGQFNVLVPISTGTGVLLFAIFGIHDPGGVIVFALLYGFFSGAFVSLVPPTIAVLSRNVSGIGIRMGVGFFLTSFANLTGTPINGVLLGDTFAWWKPILFSGITVIAGSSFLLMARQVLSRAAEKNRL
ncbi:MFS general substrate transporter [Heliocybe sulcata]|uniref:MFS general substrate transporter n=1 Tax=Heliocybe sulcata TaxID=5364 RepID=A0A5C3MNP1_9AGAM|nr:MFS general substrate transporter [Heliocybe sulcata]